MSRRYARPWEGRPGRCVRSTPAEDLALLTAGSVLTDGIRAVRARASAANENIGWRVVLVAIEAGIVRIAWDARLEKERRVYHTPEHCYQGRNVSSCTFPAGSSESTKKRLCA